MPKPAKSAARSPAATGPANAVTAPVWFDDALADCLREVSATRDAGPVSGIAVGCSGGPDSMALTCLLQDYCRRHGIALTALIVDHGLRPDSAEEAARVADWLAERDVPCAVLTWNGARPA